MAEIEHDDEYIVIYWPRGMSLFDLNRCFFGRYGMRSPQVSGELAEKGLCCDIDKVNAVAEQLKEASDELGFYILDPTRDPEPLQLPELPTCVLATEDAEYIDPNRMGSILALYHGKNLPKGLHDEQRKVQLKMIRRRLVASRACKTTGCLNRVNVTVGMAARAIIGHKLMEQGLPYELPTLCKGCRNLRDDKLAQRRPSTVSTTDMGVIKPPSEPDSVPSRNYAVPKIPATVGEAHNNQEVLEVSNGDSAVSVAPPVEEQ